MVLQPSINTGYIIVTTLLCYMVIVYITLITSTSDDKFLRNAENQAFLVETVTAINTIKSMAVSPQMIATWDKQLAGMLLPVQVNLVAMTGQQGYS